MLYYLSFLSDKFGPFRLFDYVTFRAGGAFATSFLLTVLAIPPLLPFFRKHCVQMSARTDDAANKPRPPLMGGIIIIGSVLLSSFCWGIVTERKLVVFWLATLFLALLGMADDIIKTKYLRQERDGVKERTKVIVQAVISVAAIYALYKTRGTITMQVFFPFSKQPFQFVPGAENIAVQLPFLSKPLCFLPLWLMPLCLIIMLGFNYMVLFVASNGVNLTDGKDGLAGGCMISASLAFAVIAYLSGHRMFAEYLNIPYVRGAGEIGIYACAVAGSCLGFVWHNCAPASLIMGDTGSLALGGALALIAIMLGQQMMIPVIGFVFVGELFSAWLQRFVYRHFNGKRFFRMAPIHHHFEKMGIPDNKITVRFWIVSVLSALIALSFLKLR